MGRSILKNATTKLIKMVQSQHFSEDKLEKIDVSVRIAVLGYYQLLRVGDRLENSLVPFKQRHPQILPCKDKFIKWLIAALHQKLLHAGLQAVMLSLRYESWIILARNAIKSVISRCHIYFRAWRIFQQSTVSEVAHSRAPEPISVVQCGYWNHIVGARSNP